MLIIFSLNMLHSDQMLLIVSNVDIILTGDKDFLSLEMDQPRCINTA